MSFSWGRASAVLRKELRDYRHNRFVIMTMAMLPLIFIALPVVDIVTIPASASNARLDKLIGLSLLYMLLIPAIVPSVLSAYSVVGEREQGTLEPVLTTPLRREEFLVGKALAALVPALGIAYAVFGVFLVIAAAFAHPGVTSVIFDSSHLLVQLLFTPLLAGWSIWVGIAISARSSDVRVAQQLSTFASLPPLALVALMSLNVIAPTLGLALGLGAALLVLDGLGWRGVSLLFDRERLVTGHRSRPAARVSTGGLPRPAVGERSPTVPATLSLTRKWGGIMQGGRPFEILLDRELVGDISSQGTVELPLQPGRHTLQIGIGRRTSPTREFDASEGEMVRFWCRGQLFWPLYLASLIKADLSITLKRE